MPRHEKPTPGGSPDLVFSARYHSDLIDLLEQQGALLPGSVRSGDRVIYTVVSVRNDTGGDVARGAHLGLDGPIISADSALDTFLADAPAFSGVTPVRDTHSDRLAVTLSPIPDGVIRDCVVAGWVQAKVDITDAAHTQCQIDSGSPANFTSNYTGLPFIPGQVGTGVKWCLVSLAHAERTIVKGQATSNVTESTLSFTIDNLELVSGSREPITATLTVHNIAEQKFLDNDWLYVAYVPEQDRWEVISPRPTHYTVIGGTAPTVSGGNFTLSAVEVLAGSKDPGATALVHNLTQQDFDNGDRAYAAWNEDQTRWELISTGKHAEDMEDEFTLVRCTAAETIGSGIGPYTCNNVQLLAGTKNPGASISVHNVLGDVWANTDPLYAVYNDNNARWETFTPALLTNGCGIKPITNNHEITVDANDLINDAGYGLQEGPGTCELRAYVACGLQFDSPDVNGDRPISVKSSDLAGPGLGVLGSATPCEMEVNVGCGLEIVSDAVAVKHIGTGSLFGVNGSGMEPATNTTCEMQTFIELSSNAKGLEYGPLTTGNNDAAYQGYPLRVKVDGSTVTFNASGALQAPPDVYTGGCGIDIDGGNVVSVDNVDLAGAGLTPGTNCLIDIGAGCGITVNDNDIAVNPNDLDGDGLSVGSGCLLEVDFGCGLRLGAGVAGERPIELNLNDVDGDGLKVVTGGACDVLAVDYDCGLKIDAGQIEVDPTQLDGAGLVVGTGCELDVNPGGAISIVADAVQFDAAAAAGNGLSGSGFVLAVNAGNGITISGDNVQFNASAAAGSGLGVDTLAWILKVNTGCGVEIVSDAVAVKRADIIDDVSGNAHGLEPGDGSCNIKALIGCGLEFGSADVNGNFPIQIKRTDLTGDGLVAGGGTCDLAVNPGTSHGIEIVSDQVRAKIDGTTITFNGSGQMVASAGVTAGCGINLVGSELSVDATDLDGAGLVTEGTCGLAVNPGLGIEIVTDQVRFKASDAAGAGLTGAGAVLNVGAGCGITVNANDIAFDAASVAGAGLFVSSGCILAIGAGCGITVNANDVAFNRDDVRQSGAGNDGYGLENGPGTCDLRVLLGCGLEFGSLDVNSNFPVQVKRSDLAGDGLIAGGGTCDLAVNVGCGLEIISDQVRVKKADLAGGGLVAGSGTCDLDVNPGCGIEVVSDEVRFKRNDVRQSGAGNNGYGIENGPGTCDLRALLGDGLEFGTADGNGNFPIQVNEGCGLKFTTGELGVDNVDLAGTGLKTEGTCGLAIDLTSAAKIQVKSVKSCALSLVSNTLQLKLTYDVVEVWGRSVSVDQTTTCTAATTDC